MEVVAIILAIGFITVIYTKIGQTHPLPTNSRTLYQQFQTDNQVQKESTWLMTIYDHMKGPESSNTLDIFRDINNKIILVNHKDKVASINNFNFHITKMENDNYTYHQGKITYTGASVGGIHTGGFHTTPAGYTHSTSYSGTGIIGLDYAKNMPYFPVFFIKLNDNLLAKARNTQNITKYLTVRRDETYLKLFAGRSSTSDAYMDATKATISSNRYMAMAAHSRAVSSIFLPLNQCEEIKNWLSKLIDY